MCMKKPKAPKKTPEQLAMEAEQKAEMEARKAELAVELAKDKRSRTELEIAKSRGSYGMRSLISGSKGGMGFGMRSLLG